MIILRYGLLVVGLLFCLVGLVWIGQGSGTLPYPASSFMIDQTPWIWRGAILAVVGLGAIRASRRLRQS